ncbi:putative RNA methyltransferase [Denitrobaculum tricleocarpae]|uniref:Methyltransferase domain-containing protein n=1 Tax=Denitrobaculum tricleocarpae TaxID=2591009 RepID=A0A545SZA7_9PROT|nr:methyltransferase domain-containing protein [Denitrobaculum tricleocarpae]TQV70271.1 methyltransferase domain-containing protein [Denitrobaculum tricleocarpae]
MTTPPPPDSPLHSPRPSPLNAIPFVCPLDGQPLMPGAGSLVCAGGHSFDISARGYINLLPVQFKKSRDPGDSKSMVAARRRVLDAGLFDPLADAVCGLAFEEFAARGQEETLLVDAGCGEGFYTARLAADLRNRMGDAAPKILGADISKWAVMAAAKRSKDLAWVVASNKRLPLVQGTVTGITSLFGFETWPDWAALQRSGQFVLVVDAGPRHLIELREIIYPTLQVHAPPRHEAATANGYELMGETVSRFEASVPNAELLMDLLEMTPHGRKSTGAARDRVAAMTGLSLTLDAVIRKYRRS